MNWCVILLLISIALFIVVVVLTPPIPEHIFAAMDLGRRAAAQPDQGGMRVAFVSDFGPLIMIRRPFQSLLARTLLIMNLPSGVLAVIVSFVLRSTALSSKLISDVVSAVFILGVTAQWLGIGAVVLRVRRRSSHAA